MLVKSVNLSTVIGPTSRIPDNLLPEFAFAGKSNVGKSSLINSLMNRKSYARVSQKPGKTQTINYYSVNEEFLLVDLPGYGYAKAGEQAQTAWSQLIERYLNTSGQLRQVFLLADARREVADNDRMMLDWIRAAGFEPVIIATKMDKLKRSEVKGRIEALRRGFALRGEERMIPFSARTGTGRDQILEEIEKQL
ncbi:MAG: ribosome biogenesis GTP-binding protein YihA/YsxC [Lachnospira sp.]|nr:ribosome biogenesis GTP-binding protein YihA/YsxC [Lachnospira sp.]